MPPQAAGVPSGCAPARLGQNARAVATEIWHVTVDGAPACASPLLAPEERVEPPGCGMRNRARAEDYAAMLSARHPGAEVAVAAHGCPMRGE
jgi:hypothetical protein